MSPVIVKLGGTAAADAEVLARLVADLAEGFPDGAVIVHGGGTEASAWCSRLGLEPRFVDGVRQTTPEEMEIVEMVLAGKVNTAVVRTAARAGARPVGLSLSDAGLCTGQPVGDPTVNRTARPARVDPAILEHLLAGGFLPIVSSIGSFEGGGRGDERAAGGGAWEHRAAGREGASVAGTGVDGSLGAGDQRAAGG
ncbi:MAG: acetylglutamate kinase, partial [Spirochaetales bacterium]